MVTIYSPSKEQIAQNLAGARRVLAARQQFMAEQKKHPFKGSIRQTNPGRSYYQAATRLRKTMRKEGFSQSAALKYVETYG